MRKWLSYFDGQSRVKAQWRQVRLALDGPESSMLDIVRPRRGFQSSIGAIWQETSHVNLLQRAPDFAMPVFFFLGRHDRWIPPHTSEAYLDSLTAPSKRIVWFEESGHQPFIDQAGDVTRALQELVLPVASCPRPSRS